MLDNDKVYLRFRGRTLGPFPSNQAMEMLQRGQITRLHEVSADGASWIRAEEFYKSFFGRNAAAEVVEKEAQKTEEKPKEGGEPNSEQWYAYFANQKQGPMTLVVLQQHVLSGSVNRDTLVWRPGLADWQAAVIVIPGLFPKNMPPKEEVVATATKAVAQSGLFLDIIQAFVKSKTWVQLIAFLWVLSSLGGLLFQGIQFVMVLRSPIPGPLAAFMATGLALGMLVQGVILYCGILLLNYSQTLTQLKYQRTEADLLHAGNTLSRFFTATGIVVLVSLIGSLLLVLLFVLLAAAGMEGLSATT